MTKLRHASRFRTYCVRRRMRKHYHTIQLPTDPDRATWRDFAKWIVLAVVATAAMHLAESWAFRVLMWLPPS